MKQHTARKPKEELEEELKESIETAEQPSPSPSPEEPEPSQPSPSPEPEPEPEPEKDPEPSPSPEEKPDTEDEDWKKRHAESTREAQIIAARNKQLQSAIDASRVVAEPTDEDMQKEYADWDVMSETEQKLAKKQFINDKRFEMIDKAAQEGRDFEEWIKKVETFAEDPKVLLDNPELEGRAAEFRSFASKKSHRGVDLNILVSAFLRDMEKSAKPVKKGGMFPTGTGGHSKTPGPNDGKISIAESERLMKTDFRKYSRLLRAGKISTEI